MTTNYTVLAFIRNEPLRMESIIKNFEGYANIIALLDENDKETESILIEHSIEYRMRPKGFMSFDEKTKTEWMLNQSPTDYVFICYASFYIPVELLKYFKMISEKKIHDAIKFTAVYWSHGSLVLEPTFFCKPGTSYFFNRKRVELNKVCIHNEFMLDEKTNFFTVPYKLTQSLHVMRDDDMSAVISKSIGYAEREARQLYEKSSRVNFIQLITKPLFNFLNSYIRHGGFRSGAAGLIFHINQSIYVFLVYSRLWEIQNHKSFDENRQYHHKLRMSWLSDDKVK